MYNFTNRVVWGGVKGNWTLPSQNMNQLKSFEIFYGCKHQLACLTRQRRCTTKWNFLLNLIYPPEVSYRATVFLLKREHAKLVFLSRTRDSNKNKQSKWLCSFTKGKNYNKKIWTSRHPNTISSKALKPSMATNISLPMRQRRKTKKWNFSKNLIDPPEISCQATVFSYENLQIFIVFKTEQSE